MAVTKRSNAGPSTTAAPPPSAGAKGTARPSGEAADGRSRRACLHTQLRKTKICMYHLRGCCQYGEDCAFAHSCNELQGIPDLSKTRLCKAVLAGSSCDNPECHFAHSEEELRSTNLFFKKTLCIWNEKGKCRNGDQCRFAHGSEELRGACAKAAEQMTSVPVSTGGKQKTKQEAKQKAAAEKKAAVSGSRLTSPAELREMIHQAARAGASPIGAAAPSLEPMKIPILGAGSALSPSHMQAPRQDVAKASGDDVAATLMKLQEKISALSQRCSRMSQSAQAQMLVNKLENDRMDQLGHPATPPGLDSPGGSSYGVPTGSTYAGSSRSGGSHDAIGCPMWHDPSPSLLGAAQRSGLEPEDAAHLPYLANLVALTAQARQRAQQQLVALAQANQGYTLEQAALFERCLSDFSDGSLEMGP
eukprot:TRINITY_DN100892_c0_g1_i1.p1 TRINITY_DN100892_c0_g1~~TRINITY_DN100892_c0_g1_i1.p1  ORF type:complete len:418 (-),score=101.88 TRINITY_DN100892_c0_g1_i1:314-1567(-)